MLVTFQHGCRPGLSTTSQLLEVVEHFSNEMDKCNSIDAIYLDLSKAFDSVPLERLLIKVKAYGIIDQVFNWIQAFLHGRRQKVVINSSYSVFTGVGSGVRIPKLAFWVLLYFDYTSTI